MVFLHSKIKFITANCIEAGGIPPEIFQLKELKKLVLSCLAIRSIPSDITKLKKLKRLNVECCPLLDSITPALAFQRMKCTCSFYSFSLRILS